MSPCSELWLFLKLGEASDGDLAAFLGLGLEDEGVSVLPDLDLVGLTGEHMGEEASGEFGEPLGIAIAELLIDHAGSDTGAAETVDDRAFETAEAGHVGVHVKGIEVSVQAVEEGLVGGAGAFNDSIGGACGDFRVLHDGIASLVAIASDASNHEGAEDLAEHLAIVGILDQRLLCKLSHLALVSHVGNALLHTQLDVSGDGLIELKVLLSIEEHHRVEGREARDVEYEVALSVGDDAGHRRESLEVAIVFVGELEVVSIQGVLLETNTQRVENHLVVRQLHIVGRPLRAQDLLDIHFGSTLFHHIAILI